MELINIKDVNVKYPNGVYAIKDFSVSIKKGDFVFVKQEVVNLHL